MTPAQAAAQELPACGLNDLVNRLAQELAESRRALAAATRKLGSTRRTLEGRTRELAQARAALDLLRASLDSTADGVLATGRAGGALHCNARFVQMWSIPPDKLTSLNDDAVLALQLAQVCDPEHFLSLVELRRACPDTEQFSVIELTDGRVLECRMAPRSLRGKHWGTVSTFHDITERERMAREITALEARLPLPVAQAPACAS